MRAGADPAPATRRGFRTPLERAGVTTPVGIDLDRHLHLDERRRPLVFRRAVLAVVALIVLSALLGLFGQVTSTRTASGGSGTLTVASPDRVRGGLMFTTRFTIDARGRIAHPKLVLDAGWLSGMQINSIVPQPADETSVDGRAVFSFAALPAGGQQDYFVGFQVDPTTVGRQHQTTRLLDGARLLATVRRTLTVLP
jgi:hypothetical protein